MQAVDAHDWFELCLEKYPDLPSVALIRSMELKFFPRECMRAPVLDLCCGDGFFTSCLGVRSAFGCDIDSEAVQHARRLKQTYQEVRRADARDLEAFADEVFNTVFSNCALEHIDGIDQALRSIARVLKPQGSLIMSVPAAALNEWFFPSALFRSMGLVRYAGRLCEEYNNKQAHINILNLDDWSKKLEGSGFEVQKNLYLFSRREYQLVTFFESFALDVFPGPLLRTCYSLFRKAVPLAGRKALWRILLKHIYREAQPRDSGGELFIVAAKKLP